MYKSTLRSFSFICLAKITILLQTMCAFVKGMEFFMEDFYELKEKYSGKKFSLGTVLFIIVAVFFVILFIMYKYKNEGEKNMPLYLNKILVISSAEGESKSSDNSLIWDLNVNQYNDVYLNFEKNTEYSKNDYIESISIENIKLTKQPKIGEIELYMPNSTEGADFSYDSRYLIKDSLTYKGSFRDDAKRLEIARTGGTFLFRILNKNVGEYVSDDGEEITYDGTLLGKAGINNADLAGELNFDVVIRTNRTAYRGNLSVLFPGEKIQEEGVTQIKPDEYIDIVFKRERK